MRFPIHPHRFAVRRTAAFTLVEVLIAMALLLIGIGAVVGMLQVSIRDTQRAVDTTTAAYLAQMKAEEIRRDDTAAGGCVAAIQARTTADPTTLITWPQDTRFAYGFCGESVTAPAGANTTTGDMRDRRGVARVIICYSLAFKPRTNPYDPQAVLYELRFDH